METMGMTDKQFDSFLRQLIENLLDSKKEVEEEQKTDKLQRVIDNLQMDLES